MPAPAVLPAPPPHRRQAGHPPLPLERRWPLAPARQEDPKPLPAADPAAVKYSVTGPPPQGKITHPLDAERYFYAVRNPAPGGRPAQRPVPRAETAAAARAAAIPRTGPAWTSLGPASTTAGQIPGAGNVSGRVYSIVPDPTDSNIIYIAAASGGVWKTANKGQSWTPTTDAQPSLSTTAIVLDPTNHLNVYAATGDPTATNFSYGANSYFGAGILFSSNGGTSWTTIGASTFTGVGIYDMAISPTGQTLYVAATNGFYVGTLASGNWTFAQLGLGGPWTSVRVNPGDATIVNVGQQGGPWIYSVTTGTLTPATICLTAPTCTTPSTAPAAGVARTTIAVDPVAGHSNVVYASMACDTQSGVCPTTTTCGKGGPATCPQAWWGLYESTDSGATFHLLAPPDAALGTYEYSQTDYDLSLGVDPLNDAIIYFGLIDLWSYNSTANAVTNISSPDVPQSQISCYPWDTYRFTIAQGVHCDQHAVGFDTSGTLYAGNDGGVFQSPPRSEGAAWNDLNTNLDITQFYPGASVNPANPNRLLGGTQDNGTQTTDGATWQMTDAGDGAFTAIDPTDPANTWYDSYVNLSISKTTNGSTPWSTLGGPTWTVSTTGLPIAPLPPGSPESPDFAPVQGAIFIAPYTMDPAHHLNLLAGADRPYLTTNGATTWTDISNGTTFVTAGTGDGLSATTICPDQTGGGSFYVGTTDGNIFTTSNGYSGAPTWTQASTGLPGQWVTRIVCGSGGTVYATIGGSQTTAATHVFQKASGAGSWTSLQGNLPNTTVSTLVIDPRTTPATFYVATDLGVYTSANGGTTWSAYGGGLPNVGVVDLQLDATHNTLYSFTHGRGAWSTTIGAVQTPGAVSIQPPAAFVPTTQSFPVTLVAQAPSAGLSSWSVQVSYDPTLLTVVCTPSAGSVCDTSVLGTAGVTGAAAPSLSGSQTLATMTFTATGTAGKQSALAVTATLNAAAVTAANGLLRIGVQGDVTLDGLVQSLDALCLLREVANLPPTGNCTDGPLNQAAAIVNNLPPVSATDALCVLRIVATLPSTQACPIFPSPSNPHPSVSRAASGVSRADAGAAASGSPAAQGGSLRSGAGPQVRSSLSLSATSVSLSPGRQATVAVRSDAAGAGLGSWTVDVGYDAKAVQVLSCQAAAGAICNVSYAAGVVRIVGASASGLSGSQTLATLSFGGLGHGRSQSRLSLTAPTLTDPSGAAGSG